MIRIFAGYDPREAVGFHVFCQSLIERTKEPVAITPFYGKQRDGTNAFIYQRFLVPYFTGFKGKAIFMDASDMLMLGDIDELNKIAHYTLGIPEFYHYKDCDHSKPWHSTRSRMLNGLINMKDQQNGD